MSKQEPSPYSFGDLPIDDVTPGTTLFVAGSGLSRAEDLALALVLSGAATDDGMLLLSTNTSSGKLLDRCEGLSPGVDATRLGIVDCSGTDGEASESGARVEVVSTPNDLTGLGIRFSTLYEALYTDGPGRVRTALFSVSTLLMYTDMRTVFRFLHTLAGRIDGTGGLGVFAIDPSSHDEQTVSTLTHLADGRIEVRETDADGAHGELRVRGLADQPDGWQPFTLPR